MNFTTRPNDDHTLTTKQAELLTRLESRPSEERGETVVIVLTVFLEWMMVALRTRQPSPQEQLRRRFRQNLRRIVDDKIVRRAVGKTGALSLDQL